ncbi:Holliday junction resolvase RuvX [Sinimarinibacterium sp. NLF-5-8]|uniref:Holliday junction resolvase RuvX n=1 Tax=Sinimarinibacterium sp. NLF-5-8 TaxID=2698684 RepID=UPI00137C0964|nr:Holliday junction resolvase RuvX [Sinimarinibacterium sp. NLF-5-8]QHS09501.1 Holliday junction resolvase RuvX [Sinimarinibacterium sp. NLF-5-8]
MSGTYLGFDYGDQRTGVAVGDDITGQARALTTIATGDWAALDRLLQQWRPAALIVGLPLDEDGNEQRITHAARAFAQDLRARQSAPVHEADERYSSRAADDVLRNARASGQMTRRVRKGDRDSHAAQVILAQWLGGA